MTQLRSPQQRAGVPHLVIDDFLSASAADGLLAAVIAAEPQFAPTSIVDVSGTVVDTQRRASLHLADQSGVDLAGLIAAIVDRAGDICQAIGVPGFAIHKCERSVVAHGDGDFYTRHIDTYNAQKGHVRVVSCVYYLHQRPAAFSGGELALYSVLGHPDAVRIAPRHNRLVAFPSFFPHEVLPIASTGRFPDSRFSVNCWLRRSVGQSHAGGEQI